MSPYTPITYESVTGNFPCQNEKIQIHGQVDAIGIAMVIIAVLSAAQKIKHPSKHSPSALPMVTGKQYWPLFSNDPYPTQDFPLPPVPLMVPDLSIGIIVGQCKQMKLQHAWDTKLRLNAVTIDNAL